jgi:two-component system LytT family response regulator
VNLLIVDDEQAVRAGLVKLCERADDLHVVGEAASGARALKAVKELRPDLTLLDAELPDMSGFDVLRALGRRQQRRTIVLSANAQDGPTAFSAGAIDHLMKPVNEDAFNASILRAREQLKTRFAGAHRVRRAAALMLMRPDVHCVRPAFLVGEREHRLYPLDPAQIEYIESAGNYVKYHLGPVAYIARESIKRLDAVLAPTGFVRIERSVLLNIRAISYAQPIGHGTFAFTLVSGTRLYSGHAFRDTILAALPLRRRAPIRGGMRFHPAADSGVGTRPASRRNNPTAVG